MHINDRLLGAYKLQVSEMYINSIIIKQIILFFYPMVGGGGALSSTLKGGGTLWGQMGLHILAI